MAAWAHGNILVVQLIEAKGAEPLYGLKCLQGTNLTNSTQSAGYWDLNVVT